MYSQYYNKVVNIDKKCPDTPSIVPGDNAPIVHCLAPLIILCVPVQGHWAEKASVPRNADKGPHWHTMGCRGAICSVSKHCRKFVTF